MRSLLLVMLGCGTSAPAAPVMLPAAAHDAAIAVEPGPNDAECDALIDHAIELQAPGDAGVGSAARTTLRGEVHAKVLARCRAMPRAVYRCAMAAATLDAFTSCDPS